MSKISISLKKPSNNLDLVKGIHKILGIPLSTISRFIAKGKLGVFYTTELFLNDHPQKEREIRNILQCLENLKIEPFIMEIAHDEAWENVKDFNSFEISKDELVNTLNRAKDNFN